MHKQGSVIPYLCGHKEQRIIFFTRFLAQEKGMDVLSRQHHQ